MNPAELREVALIGIDKPPGKLMIGSVRRRMKGNQSADQGERALFFRTDDEGYCITEENALAIVDAILEELAIERDLRSGEVTW